MERIILKIEGMVCGMCEAHISDTVRKTLPAARKVSSSARKGECSFLYEEDIDEDLLRKAINATGYRYQGLSKEPYQKKHILFQKTF